VCFASSKPSCSPIGTLLPEMADKVGVAVANTTVYMSSVFWSNCFGMIVEVVLQGK
ncbi:hypothetical protein AAVH_42545, partial [Aphelenchoides avenae]